MGTSTEGPVASGVPEAWVKLPPEEALKDLLQGHPYSLTGAEVPAMGRLLASHPRFVEPFFGLFAEVMFSPESPLTREEREMVAAASAAAQQCFY